MTCQWRNICKAYGWDRPGNFQSNLEPRMPGECISIWRAYIHQQPHFIMVIPNLQLLIDSWMGVTHQIRSQMIWRGDITITATKGNFILLLQGKTLSIKTCEVINFKIITTINVHLSVHYSLVWGPVTPIPSGLLRFTPVHSCPYTATLDRMSGPPQSDHIHPEPDRIQLCDAQCKVCLVISNVTTLKFLAPRSSMILEN